MSQQSQQSVVESAKIELKLFTEWLCKELEKNVFDEDDRKVISQAKVITDLKSIFCVVKQDGTTKVVASKASQYVKAIRELPIRSLINMPDDVLNAQFNDLVCCIELLVPRNTNVQNIINVITVCFIYIIYISQRNTLLYNTIIAFN